MDDKQRQRILERDGHKCQLDKLFGISELTGEPCHEVLEVHHLRYPERSDDDLITVCLRCHDILTDGIRKNRLKETPEPTIIVPGHAIQIDREQKQFTTQEAVTNKRRES